MCSIRASLSGGNRNMSDEGLAVVVNDPETLTGEDVKKLIARSVTPCQGGWEIVDYTIRPYSEEKLGFLGSHRRLAVTIRPRIVGEKKGGNNPTWPLPRTVAFFVKSIPYEVPSQAKYVTEKGVFDQESNFFKYIVPELRRNFKAEPWSPECYLIKKNCLVYEDLKDTGFEMSGKLLNEREIRAGLCAIARLHAASLHAETRLGRAIGEICPGAFEERAFLHRGNQYNWYLAGVDVAVHVADLLGLETSRIKEACERVFEATKPSCTKRNVASHGDLWSNNLMFDDGDGDDVDDAPRCRLVDFQLARYSPLGHDVAQFLYLCASRNFRDTRLNELLRYYHQSLSRSLEFGSITIDVAIPPLPEIERSYEEQRLGAVVTAVLYFPTVLLNGTTAATIMNDTETYEKFVMQDRRDLVDDNMKRDPRYRVRINEAVRELVELSLKLDELPRPC